VPDNARIRRERLLGRLRELFLREGFGALSVGDLAERLRCSKSTLYLVAPSKEQIVVATVRSYFKQAADRVEAAVARSEDPARRLALYFDAVATELQPASDRFYADLAAFEPALAVYRDNTVVAARRVQELVVDGVETGALRPVNAAFVGAAVAQVMTAIQRGEIEAATGMPDAEAYRHLADLVTAALRVPV
jgi:AcrR family transcriptional regulator